MSPTDRRLERARLYCAMDSEITFEALHVGTASVRPHSTPGRVSQPS
jgi:hypothetical protein